MRPRVARDRRRLRRYHKARHPVQPAAHACHPADPTYGDAQDRNVTLEKRVRRAGDADARRWLPFLDTYRTLCVVPEPEFRRLLEEIREMQFAA